MSDYMNNIHRPSIKALGIVTLFYLAFSTAPMAACAQRNPAVLWQKCIGSHADDCFYSVKPTADGGAIAVGFITLPAADTRTDHGHKELLAVRFSADNEELWRKTYGGRENDEACDVVISPNGGFLLVGSTNSPQGDITHLHGGYDFWALRLDDQGTMIWQKTFGGCDDDYAFGAAVASDGTYAIVGTTLSNDGDVSESLGKSDAWMIAIDDTGKVVWQRCFGGPGEDAAFRVVRGIDDGFVAVGRIETQPTAEESEEQSTGVGNVLAAKISDSGTIVWQNDFGGWEEDIGYGIATAPDSTYVIVGMSRSCNDSKDEALGGDDALVLDIDLTGHMLWNAVYGGWGDEELRSVAPIKTEGLGGLFVCVGSTSSRNVTGDVHDLHGNSQDIWVVSIDGEGNLIKQLCLGGLNTDVGYDGYSLGNDMIRVAGAASPWGEGDIASGSTGQDAWIATVVLENEPDLSVAIARKMIQKQSRGR